MKKDIEIPIVKDVHVVAVHVFNEDFRTFEWTAYIINNSNELLETVLIVSEGKKDQVRTSLMRHSLKSLPAKSFAKIEFMEDSILEVHNYFRITYFQGAILYDKVFEFPAHSIIEDNAVSIPLLNEKGVVAR